MLERAPFPETRAYPPRSKMVDTYLADIARKLATGQVSDAKALALCLPHIGASLAADDLHSSSEEYQNWCARWVGPARTLQQYADWCAETGQCFGDSSGRVPFVALQALRLRRFIREVTAPRVPPPGGVPPQDQPAAEICDVLLHAARDWYAQVGRHDAMVQSNLARLGVLR